VNVYKVIARCRFNVTKFLISLSFFALFDSAGGLDVVGAYSSLSTPLLARRPVSSGLARRKSKMSNKPVRVRQRELETVIRGARNQGAKSIEVRIGKRRRSSFLCAKTSRSRLRPTRKSPSNVGHAAPSSAVSAAGDNPLRQNGVVCAQGAARSSHLIEGRVRHREVLARVSGRPVGIVPSAY